MSKIAAIYLGTNSIRLMLCEVIGKQFKTKNKEVITTRIGKDMGHNGLLTERAMEKNIEAIKYFKKRQRNMELKKF